MTENQQVTMMQIWFVDDRSSRRRPPGLPVRPARRPAALSAVGSAEAEALAEADSPNEAGNQELAASGARAAGFPEQGSATP